MFTIYAQLHGAPQGIILSKAVQKGRLMWNARTREDTEAATHGASKTRLPEAAYNKLLKTVRCYRVLVIP